MLETITKLKAPESEHLLLQNCLLHMRRMCHFGILYYQAKGVVVGLDDGGRIVDHAGRRWFDAEDAGLVGRSPIDKAMLGPNERIELLGATAGKGLIAAAASFEVVRRRYVGFGPGPVKSLRTMT